LVAITIRTNNSALGSWLGTRDQIEPCYIPAMGYDTTA
jgi:hypothetical protein